MNKLKAVKFEDFTLKKAVISNDGVTVSFEEKRVIDGTAQVIDYSSVSAKYIPHPDLIDYRDSLKEYLVKAMSLQKGYDMALKYTKGEQKQKVEEAILDLYNTVEITGISIGGADQLRGAVISGKIESFNKSKCALNTPRIVFSSDKIGIETDVDGQVELIEREVYKYLFEGKKAQKELFDDSDDNGDLPKAKTIPVVGAKEVKAQGEPVGLE